MPPRPRRASSSSATASSKRAASSAAGDAALRILVLHGPEDMLKREHLQALRTALREKHGDIEIYNFDGKNAALADVLDELRSYSLMQVYKLVVVDDADEFVKRYREPLERYAAEPVESATLVLRATQWNRGNLDKAVEKVGSFIKCEALKPAQAAAWLEGRAAEVHRVTLSSAAATRLVERLGSDLGRLDSELSKLAVAAVAAGKGGEAGAITEELIDAAVGRGSDEQAWAIQDVMLRILLASPAKAHAGSAPAAALATGAALEKLHEIVELAGQSDVLVTYAIADLMRKLHLAAVMLQQGQAPFAIGTALRIWPKERQRPFVDAAARLGVAGTAAAFAQALASDRRAKSGLGDFLRNLECYCATLADQIH
jgi:DNA polymerase III delta subunit